MRAKLTGWLLLSAVLASGSGWTWADDEAESQTPFERNQAVVILGGEHAAQGFWIGIMGTPADELLKSHLKLDAGLVVQHVVPDSPAGKAGVKEHDVLLQFNETKVDEISDLAAAIGENKGEEAALKLIRDGDELSLKVTPEKRPASSFGAAPLPLGDMDKLQDWLKKMEKGELGDDPLRMLFVQPGIVMPKEWKDLPEFPSSTISLRLPNNTTITVNRKDDGPAKAVVKRGDQSWEVTEEEIDQLPEDLQPVVRGIMLGANFSLRLGDSLGLRLREEPSRAGATPPAADEEATDAVGPDAAEMDALLKQMEQLKQQLRESSKQLERLQQKVQKLQ